MGVFMKNILIAGAGRIGTLIACLLAETNQYQIYLADIKFDSEFIAKLKNINILQVNVQDHTAIADIIHRYDIQAIISCLPFYCNITIARIAKEFNLDYFDLTEDVNVTAEIEHLAKNANNAFVPQCGLAPGFVNIVAHSLMHSFTQLNSVKLRVGALPQYADNPLRYALTWSTDGLINEYINPCLVIENSTLVKKSAMDDLEELTLDGVQYEVFNTSGGLGSLAKKYAGKVKELNYKTIRYPGHCEKMRFLLQELRLAENRELLKSLLENSLPRTQQDVVVVYVHVTGEKQGKFYQEKYFHKFYPQEIVGLQWTAIQVSTAAGACAVVDLVLNSDRFHGFVTHEDFAVADIMKGQFKTFF